MAYTSVFEDYLNQLGEPGDTQPQEGYFPGLLQTPQQTSDRNSLYDFLGNAAWGALDEAGFAIPGVIAKQVGIDPITPETGLGSAGEVAGRFGGFILGAPMKVGVRALGIAAKPFIKAAGKQTISGVTKKVAGEGAKLATKKGASKGINSVVNQATAKYQTLNQKAKWSKNIANNFTGTSKKILNKTVENNIKRGLITRAEGDALKEVFRKNMRTQSFDDFIGMMQSRYPGKKGFVLGEMLNEAVIWGTIDGLMEFPRAYSQDRPYDKFAPLWGVGIGGAMGSLNAFMPGGKGSSFRKDFLAGIQGVFNKGHFRNMSYEDLVSHSKIHAGFKKTSEAEPIFTKSVDFQGHKFDVDFRAPELLDSKTMDGKLLNNKTKESILRKALSEQTSDQGKELIRWAAKEEWENISDNWARMVLSGAIFNMPVLAELDNLDQMPPETLATQFLIGAFMGRKGLPSSMDLGRRVNHLRKGLSSLGIEPKQLIEEIPTFGAAGVAELNPMNNHEHLRSIQDDLRDPEIGIITTEYDTFSRSIEPGEESAMMASSKEDLSIFQELHYYLNGTKKEGEHVLSLDEIPASVARDIQNRIKNKEWEVLEGGKVETLDDFRTVMDEQVEQSAKLFENQIVETVKTILKEPGVDVPISDNEMFGRIPKQIDVSEEMRRAARAGELTTLTDKVGNPLSGEGAVAKLNEVVVKINNLIKTAKQIGRAEENTNPDTNIKFISSEETFGHIRSYLEQAEGMINNQLGNKIDIDFADMPDIGGFLQINQIKKAKKAISQLFDRKNPSHDDIKKALINSGILVRSDDSLIDTYFLKGDIGNIDIINAPSDADRSAAYKLLNSIHSIVAAKNQYDPDTSGIEIQIDYNNIIGGKFSLENQLGIRGLNTSEGMLTMYTKDIVRTIYTDNLAASNLTSGHIDALLELNISGYDVAKYVSSSKTGAFGFSVRKLTTNSDDATIIDQVNAYNKIIDGMKEAGPEAIKVEKEPFVVVSDAIATDLFNRVHNNIGESAKLAKEDLIDFINRVEGNDRFRDSMIAFMQLHPNNASKLMAFLHANKIIKIDKGPGSKRYSYDLDAMTNAKVKEIQEKIDRAGVTTNDVDAYIKEAEEAYHAMMDSTHDTTIGSKHLSQSEFFEKYSPELKELKDQTDFIINKIRLNNGLGDINPNRIQDIMDNLTVEVKQGDKLVRVNASSLDPNSSKFRQVRADVASLVSSKVNAITVKMIGMRDNGLDFTNSTMQDNKLTQLLKDMNIDYFVINPIAITRIKDKAGFARKRVIDLSALSSNKKKHSDDEIAAYALFEKNLNEMSKYLLDGNEFDITGSDGSKGITMIQVADWLPPIGIKKSDKDKVLKAFEDMFTKYDEGGVYRKFMSQDVITRMENLRENMRKEQQNFDYHEDALRSMIYEKMLGPKEFLKLLDTTGSELYKKTAKRGSLFYTPSAKQLTADGIAALDNLAVNSSEINVINKYRNQDGYGLAVFNDDPGNGFGTSVKNRVNRDLKKLGYDLTFEDLQPGREDVSGLDSISYISSDFAKMLSMYYGLDFDGTHYIFKPIISSDKAGKTMYGKTVFIHDPTMQHVFDKNQGLDVLLAKSGAKIGAGSDETFGKTMIQKHTDALFDVNQLEGSLGKNTINMDFNTLGIIQAPKKKANAKLSNALWNYTDSSTSQMIFSKYIKGPLNESMANIQKIFSNPAMLRHAMLDLQGVDTDFAMSSMMESGASGKNMGAFIQWLQADKHSNPRAFGDRIVMNILKRKLIDPKVTPETELNGTRYGGQAVLAQSLNPEFRNLKQSLFIDGKMVQYGEMMMPGFEMESSIRMPDNSDLQVKIIKRNAGKTADEIITLDDFRNTLSDNDKNIFDQATTMGQLHNILGAVKGDYQIGVTTTRFPRTRPNDMMVLGVKDFLGEEFGNSMIINDYDVLSVFEGDYDVDKAHYMWMNTDETFNHINDMNEYWIPGVEPGQFSPEVPGLQLIANNSARANAAWRESAADVKAFKNGIGVVQKMTRQVNHLKDISSTIKDAAGNEMGLLFTNSEGEQIIIDWDNKEWFMRTALEGQAIIDAQADNSLFTHMEDWLDNYLFPLMDESISRTEVNADRVGFLRSKANNKTNKRIRLFKKLNRDGSESNKNLTDLEKDMIRTIMREYGKMLQLGTDVYDGTGDSRKADYSDYISIGGDYFKHMKDLNSSIYKKLKYKYGKSDEFRRMFPETTIIPKKWDYKQKKSIPDKEKAYRWIQKGSGPFHQDVITRGQRVSEGSGGSPFEQSLQTIYSQDPLNFENRMALLQDEYIRMDNALDKFLEGAIDEDAFASNIMGAFKKKNDAIKAIKWAKSQIYRAKTPKQKEALNKIIEEKEMYLKEVMGVELSKKYKETKMAKHLPEAGRLISIQNDEEVKEGTIQYYTLAPELSNFKGSHGDFNRDLTNIRNMERVFFADDVNMKDSLPYGDHSLLTADQRLRLKFRPDQDTYNEVFGEIMDQMVDKHGMIFLWNYGAPKQLKNHAGVYNNRAMPIATVSNKRYKRMINYIAKKAAEDSYFKQVLGILAKRDGVYRNLFSGNTNMLGADSNGMIDQMLRIPKFGSEMIGMYDSYTKYNVDKDASSTDPYRSGPSFDHATAFFRAIYKMAGREGEFDEAATGLSRINELMLNNRLVDPITYNTLMSKINKDIYGFVSRRFNNKQTEAGLEPITSPDLMNNELFIMIGAGTKMGNGLTLNPVDAMSYGKALFGEVMAKQASEIVTKPGSDRLDTFLSCLKV